MQIHRFIREGAQLSKHSLRLAERVTKQNRCQAAFAIGAPPTEYFLDDLRCCLPLINRQRERRFADEYVAELRFEWSTRCIWLAPVVARHDPDSSVVLDAQL